MRAGAASRGDGSWQASGPPRVRTGTSSPSCLRPPSWAPSPGPLLPSHHLHNRRRPPRTRPRTSPRARPPRSPRTPPSTLVASQPWSRCSPPSSRSRHHRPLRRPPAGRPPPSEAGRVLCAATLLLLLLLLLLMATAPCSRRGRRGAGAVAWAVGPKRVRAAGASRASLLARAHDGRGRCGSSGKARRRLPPPPPTPGAPERRVGRNVACGGSAQRAGKSGPKRGTSAWRMSWAKVAAMALAAR